MSISTITVAPTRLAVVGRVSDFLALTKPRIAVLELLVVLAAGVVATWGQPDPSAMLHVMLGTLLVASSASAANQWLERHLDARMARTASRPLAAGRLASWEALAFSATCLLAGFAQLLMNVNAACAGWAMLTWLLYVAVYTPLKTRSAMNTAVGAVAGALPIFIGWSATGITLDGRAFALFSILFLWQFPHFMAIAWLYRRDYAKAGHQMLTVVEPTGWRAGRQAAAAALALIPVSVIPLLSSPGTGAVLYALGAGVLGGGQLVLAGMFWQQANDFHARLLLRASLVYLPTLLVMLMLAPWI
jgi:protoheme IX farnesyltransferase